MSISVGSYRDFTRQGGTTLRTVPANRPPDDEGKAEGVLSYRHLEVGENGDLIILTVYSNEIAVTMPVKWRCHALRRAEFRHGSNQGNTRPADFYRERAPRRSAGFGTPRRAFPAVLRSRLTNRTMPEFAPGRPPHSERPIFGYRNPAVPPGPMGGGGGGGTGPGPRGPYGGPYGGAGATGGGAADGGIGATGGGAATGGGMMLSIRAPFAGNVSP